MLLSLTLVYSPQCQKVLRYLPSECLSWSQHPAQFRGCKSYERSNITFSICHLTYRWSCDQSPTLQGLEPLKVNHHLAQFGAHRSSTSGDLLRSSKFGGFRYCGNGDKTFLICPMILQDQVIKRSGDFMSGQPSH